MPSHDLPGLSPVAIEYFRYHDELEAAREVFLAERAKLLDALGAQMENAAGEQGLRAAPGKRDDKAGEFDLTIVGKYTKRRADSGKRRASGISVHLGAFAGHVGAQTTIWFQLRLVSARRQALALDELAQELGPEAKVMGEAGWTYIRTAAQAADALDVGALSEDASRLPALFAVADAWLAKRWG